MSTSTSEEEEQILRAAGYDEMAVDSSTIVARVSGGEWERVEAVRTYYTDRLCRVTKNTYGPSFCFSSTAGVLRVSRDSGGDQSVQKQVEAQFFTASAGAEYSKLYKGGNAKLTLAGGNVSAVNYHVGAGLSTGAGIKDEAVQVKLAGCGFSVGRKMGVSVFDNEVGVDFGKCKTQ